MNELMGKPEVNQIVGMTFIEAKAHLEKHGYTCRIVVKDGRALMVKGDIDMNRVNIFMANNVIVDIDKIG